MTILTSKFEGTRVRLLSIPSDAEWVEWAEDEDPYEQLNDIAFVDGNILHFIVDGLPTAFPKATVIAVPLEIRQLRERKSEGELESLTCANEVGIL